MSLFFLQLSEDLMKVNVSRLLNDIFSEKNIQEWVIDAIQLRLEVSGIDGKDKKMKTDRATDGFYSERTKDIKSYFGQNYSNVTLKDSGDFYKSMKIILNNAGFEIDGDFEKENENIYKNFTNSYASQKEFSSDIMSLTSKEMTLIMETKVIPLINKKLNEII